MDIRQRLGENVQRLRRRTGQSQEEFAHEAGLNRTYLSDIERGKRNPTIKVIEKIAEVLKVTPGSLLD